MFLTSHLKYLYVYKNKWWCLVERKKITVFSCWRRCVAGNLLNCNSTSDFKTYCTISLFSSSIPFHWIKCLNLRQLYGHSNVSYKQFNSALFCGWLTLVWFSFKPWKKLSPCIFVWPWLFLWYQKQTITVEKILSSLTGR